MTHRDFNSSLLKELNPLRRYALQLTRNIEDANDLLQETMLKALSYKEKFMRGTNIRGWLYTIMKNSFINNYRRMMKRNTFLDTTDNTYFLDLPSQRTENEAELKFIRRDIDNAIDALSPDLKTTFKMNVEGYKYHEIAGELSIPLGTVKTRIFVAKRYLRGLLKTYGRAFGYKKSLPEPNPDR